MEWKNYCEGFAIQGNTNDWEGKCLALVGIYHKIPFKIIYDTKKIPKNWIPSGTVPWVSEAIGEIITPDYYPKFLSPWITRKVWREDKWPLGKRVFIKPADRNKRFTGFTTTGKYAGKKRGPYWCSDIVSFKNEWRYYVAYGKLIGAYWYWGDGDDSMEAPKIDVKWPENWCGTADFGTFTDGTIELVESHAPFACGWYGKKHEEYAEFLTLGWKWIRDKQYKQSF